MNNSLKAVCDKHNINFSSAKNVIQIYKKEGRLEKKVVRCRKNKAGDGSKCDPEMEHEEEVTCEKGMEAESTEKKSLCSIML